MFLKNSQYSQENTCVGVPFNEIAGLKPPSQVFFCEYCKIYKNNFFHRPPFRRAIRGGEEWGWSPLSFFKNHKKWPDFGKKGLDREISIQNAVLKYLGEKTPKFSRNWPFFLKFLTKCLPKYPNSPKPPLP